MKTTIQSVLAFTLLLCLGSVSVPARNPPALSLELSTPLGSGVLIPVGFSGSEAISAPFRLEVELAAPAGQDIPFEALLGQEVQLTLSTASGPARYFHGICSRFSQGEADRSFTRYKLEMVPRLWLLTRTAGSRVFQDISVPSILREIFNGAGLDYEMHLTGAFHPRKYVVQYRETDFNFVSRLMEEEGIYYYFRHEPGGHVLVLGNTPDGHASLAEPGAILFRGSSSIRGTPGGISSWEKTQELSTGKYTLWDHHFQLPFENLEASALIQPTVQAGAVRHWLALPANSRLEIYDYPGGYAQRFDGIDQAGEDRPSDLEKIFEDNQRTVQIRIEEQAAHSLRITGSSTVPHLSAGHKFTLANHPHADGAYVVTRVSHTFRSTAESRQGLDYENSFACIPAELPYRPRRATAKPVIPGPQTAFVIEPPGAETLADKFGRVKVQFHWDREGRGDESSSCWIRVAALHAGQEAGFFTFPEIGDEVVVAFLEGDPDRPIIIGSVYNPLHLPPLPERLEE